MPQKQFERKSDKRHWLQRLTPGGWAIILTLGALTILLVIGGISWAAPRLSAVELPVLNRPTPTSVVPTSTPRPTATPLPTPTATPTSTVNFPAYWTDGMWQDANDQWWPADDVREEVIEIVKQHYQEIYDNAWNMTLDQLYETVSEEEMARYLTGQHWEDHLLSRKRYRDSGALPSEKYMIVTDRKLTVRDFASDGRSCTVADMYRDAYVLRRTDDGEWLEFELPESGVLDGTQYLGTALYRMEFDSEDGRWKQSELVGWIPRP